MRNFDFNGELPKLDFEMATHGRIGGSPTGATPLKNPCTVFNSPATVAQGRHTVITSTPLPLL
jgi:hypothetical protein